MITLPNGALGKTAYLDWTIIDPISIQRAETRQDLPEIYRSAAQNKRTKYANVFGPAHPNRVFHPLICSTYGRAAPETVDTLKTLAGKGNLNTLLQQISFAVLRFSGQALLKYYMNVLYPPRAEHGG